MKQPADEPKIFFFGCPLDCDEQDDAIREKLSSQWVSEENDPLVEVVNLISCEISSNLWKNKGSVNVPSWLQPMPAPEDFNRITAEEMVSFIDNGSCLEYASRIEKLVKTDILPNMPCMIAVDHSLTGGVYKAVAEYYGKENITLIVLDSHTDAVPMSVLAEAIQYDIDTNFNSVHDRDDPLLYNRPDSYNASSFIYHLLNEEILSPRNLFIIGVSDYPDKRALRIKDQRIKNYVNAYTGLKKKGVNFLTKKDCWQKPKKVRHLLKKIDTPFVYVSIDLDIGAQNAVEGVRFRNWKGLTENQIYRIIDEIHKNLSQKIRMVGMDITEINPRRAGKIFSSGQDRTYAIAKNLIHKFLFGNTI